MDERIALPLGRSRFFLWAPRSPEASPKSPGYWFAVHALRTSARSQVQLLLSSPCCSHCWLPPMLQTTSISLPSKRPGMLCALQGARAGSMPALLTLTAPSKTVHFGKPIGSDDDTKTVASNTCSSPSWFCLIKPHAICQCAFPCPIGPSTQGFCLRRVSEEESSPTNIGSSMARGQRALS
jgi:hypothetical protein